MELENGLTGADPGTGGRNIFGNSGYEFVSKTEGAVSMAARKAAAKSSSSGLVVVPWFYGACAMTGVYFDSSAKT